MKNRGLLGGFGLIGHLWKKLGYLGHKGFRWDKVGYGIGKFIVVNFCNWN